MKTVENRARWNKLCGAFIDVRSSPRAGIDFSSTYSPCLCRPLCPVLACRRALPADFPERVLEPQEHRRYRHLEEKSRLLRAMGADEVLPRGLASAGRSDLATFGLL